MEHVPIKIAFSKIKALVKKSQTLKFLFDIKFQSVHIANHYFQLKAIIILLEV